jgi:hypothetical protein
VPTPPAASARPPAPSWTARSWLRHFPHPALSRALATCTRQQTLPMAVPAGRTVQRHGKNQRPHREQTHSARFGPQKKCQSAAHTTQEAAAGKERDRRG